MGLAAFGALDDLFQLLFDETARQYDGLFQNVDLDGLSRDRVRAFDGAQRGRYRVEAACGIAGKLPSRPPNAGIDPPNQLVGAHRETEAKAAFSHRRVS